MNSKLFENFFRISVGFEDNKGKKQQDTEGICGQGGRKEDKF